MNEYFIAVSRRRSVYHTTSNCKQLKNTEKTTTKSWAIIKTMTLEACPVCVED